MKKKLFSFVLAFAFILTGAICLTACGNSNVGVDMFGKTYTFKTEATYSMTDGNGNKIADWEQWINSNFENGIEYYFARWDNLNNINNATDLIAYLKSDEFVTTYCETNQKTTVLIGAKIEIGAGTKTGNDDDKKGSFKVTCGDLVIDDADITAYSGNTEYTKYYTGNISGNGSTNYLNVGPGFELIDFDVKDGTIRDAKVNFLNGNKDETGYVTANMTYTNSLGLSISSGSNNAVFYITYSLASVN